MYSYLMGSHMAAAAPSRRLTSAPPRCRPSGATTPCPAILVDCRRQTDGRQTQHELCRAAPSPVGYGRCQCSLPRGSKMPWSNRPAQSGDEEGSAEQDTFTQMSCRASSPCEGQSPAIVPQRCACAFLRRPWVARSVRRSLVCHRAWDADQGTQESHEPRSNAVTRGSAAPQRVAAERGPARVVRHEESKARQATRGNRAQRAGSAPRPSSFTLDAFLRKHRQRAIERLEGFKVVQRKSKTLVGVVDGFTPFANDEDEGATPAGTFLGLLRVVEDYAEAERQVLASLPTVPDEVMQVAEAILESGRRDLSDSGQERATGEAGEVEHVAHVEGSSPGEGVSFEGLMVEEGAGHAGEELSEEEWEEDVDVVGGRGEPLLIYRDDSVLRAHMELMRESGEGVEGEEDEDGAWEGGGEGSGRWVGDEWVEDGEQDRQDVEHLVPLVPEIVCAVHVDARVVVVDLPKGLLDIGRRRLLVRWLRVALRPYLRLPGPGQGPVPVPGMPSKGVLERAGRKDILAAIQRCGGHLQTASLLHLRACRRPAGYWENEEVLGEEISRFVAASWVELTEEGVDGAVGETYFYNSVTGQVRFGEPQAPTKIPIGDEGSFVWIEDDEDCVMPSEMSLRAAGRYDLHHAIVRAGGYREVARMLDRRPSWPRVDVGRDHERVVAALEQVAEENGLPEGTLPSTPMLVEAGRADVAKAISRAGGAAAVASSLGMKTIRNQKGYWDDEERVAWGVLLFVAGQRGVDTRGLTEGHSDREALAQAAARLKETALREGWTVPSDKELMAAGRLDLRYALQQSVRTDVARRAGLVPRGRGRPRAS